MTRRGCCPRSACRISTLAAWHRNRRTTSSLSYPVALAQGLLAGHLCGMVRPAEMKSRRYPVAAPRPGPPLRLFEAYLADFYFLIIKITPVYGVAFDADDDTSVGGYPQQSAIAIDEARHTLLVFDSGSPLQTRLHSLVTIDTDESAAAEYALMSSRIKFKIQTLVLHCNTPGSSLLISLPSDAYAPT
ncbi:hypothetical protein RB195_011599 [Necator americanus]|uniref:Uncharacterized protein n=1 Tax=Necator americanus TaxID=51031 RepID=A0ABR1D6E7_NECAM